MNFEKQSIVIDDGEENTIAIEAVATKHGFMSHGPGYGEERQVPFECIF